MQDLIQKNTALHFTEAETETAFRLARQKQCPVLIDFWAPGCKGCKKMELSTYGNPEIQQYIHTYFVLIKYDISNRDVPKIQSSPILWTPTFIVFANDGSEIRKITGYLNDQFFKSEIEIGRALAFLRKAKPKHAFDILNTLVNEANRYAIPEILYWIGVAAYFLNNRNPESLVSYWQKLLSGYPESIWAQKADVLDINV